MGCRNVTISYILRHKRKHVDTRDKKQHWGKISGIAVFTLALLAVASPTHALTSISQGYSTTDSVSIGSIVSLKTNSTDQVNAATSGNANSILGVVINDANSLLSLSSTNAKQIQVGTSGILEVLVSDIGGDIKQGDSITSSSINGVGMKATINTKVVGIAQENLSSSNSSNQTYTDKAGKTHNVRLGQIAVLVNVADFYKQPDRTIIPSAFQNIANTVAGKKVNALPIIISIAIFFVTLIVVSSIVYSMIKSSIISVGRNPMSQSAIYRGMLQMSALVVGILAVAVVSIYLVLSKF